MAFVFDHQQKIARFRDFGCEIGLLPQRGGKPYLWQDLILQRPSGDLVIAKVDHFGGVLTSSCIGYFSVSLRAFACSRTK